MIGEFVGSGPVAALGGGGPQAGMGTFDLPANSSSVNAASESVLGSQRLSQIGLVRVKRGDIEILDFLRDAAGPRRLIIDVSITHDRIGSSQANPHLNGTLSHPGALDAPLLLAAKRKIDKYQATYANHHSISFLPAITSTSARMHGEFLRLLFLQAHRETEDYFAFMGTPAQPDQDQFRFRRAAFHSSLKSKVGLIAAKAAALRINMTRDELTINTFPGQ